MSEQIEPFPPEKVQACLSVDTLDIAHAIAVDVRVIAKVQEFHHHCLPCAADIGRNREYARAIAQNRYGEMTPPCIPPIRVDCVDEGLTPQSLLIGSKIHPVGVTYVTHHNNADSHHSNSPVTTSARVIQ